MDVVNAEQVRKAVRPTPYDPPLTLRARRPASQRRLAYVP